MKSLQKEKLFFLNFHCACSYTMVGVVFFLVLMLRANDAQRRSEL
jgi:hypothetical protein